jgi:hypothetical protein
LKDKEHSVDAVIKHNGWDGSGATFPDIAIIKLARKLKFKLKKPGAFLEEKNPILPACLPNSDIRKQLYNTKAFVAGNTKCVHCLICMKSAYTYMTGGGLPEDFLETS